jgi:hypothetical protein
MLSFLVALSPEAKKTAKQTLVCLGVNPLTLRGKESQNHKSAMMLGGGTVSLLRFHLVPFSEHNLELPFLL